MSDDDFRQFWRNFTAQCTHGVIQVDGIKRESTAEEKRLFDDVFGQVDASFKSIQRVFDEARRENTRRKP